MRLRFLLVLAILFASAPELRASWSDPYIDLYLNDPGEFEFMTQVQNRAERWVHKTGATVYEGFYMPLLDQQRKDRDSDERLPADSWRLSVALSRSADTLTVLGFNRNVHRRVLSRNSFLGGMYGDLYETEPLYGIPLSNYKEFLDAEEQGRLRGIVENALKSIMSDSYLIGQVQVNSFQWHFEEHPEWILLDPDRMKPILTNFCSGSESTIDSYSAPRRDGRLSVNQIRNLETKTDTLMRQDLEGKYVPFAMEEELSVKSIELSVSISPTQLSKGSEELAGYSTYVLRLDFVGISFDGSRSQCWVEKNDFAACYGDPNLLGWLNALVSNEIQRRLIHKNGP